jgi:8-oxo-dGTP pyrophosphatase MutT (NUDIX family)
VPEPHEESISVFDPEGRVVGALPRAQAKRSRLAVGAVNVLLVSSKGEVLLQRRAEDKENGGRWDKTVGGHVDEGETFDEAAVREAGEELFGDGASPRVRLARDEAELGRLLATADLRRQVVFRKAALQLNLRDVRLGPAGSGIRNAVYHVTSYLGRTDVPLGDFRPQQDEIAGLRYAAPAEVDALLVRGELAPNMAFLWLTHAQALLALAGPA